MFFVLPSPKQRHKKTKISMATPYDGHIIGPEQLNRIYPDKSFNSEWTFAMMTQMATIEVINKISPTLTNGFDKRLAW